MVNEAVNLMRAKREILKQEAILSRQGVRETRASEKLERTNIARIKAQDRFERNKEKDRVRQDKSEQRSFSLATKATEKQARDRQKSIKLQSSMWDKQSRTEGKLDKERIKLQGKVSRDQTTAETKKTTAETKKLKLEDQIKKDKAKKWKQLTKNLSKKVTAKKIVRAHGMVLNIKEHKPESVFNDESRFFRNEFEQQKGLFFRS